MHYYIIRCAYLFLFLNATAKLAKNLQAANYFSAILANMALFGTFVAYKGAENIRNQILKTSIMTIKPLADRVLIEPAPAETKTIGGIIIPDTAKEKPLQGTVVAVGQGTKDEEMFLKEGDQVLYGKYAGTELEHEGKKFLIMRQSDVVAILG